MLFRLIGLGVTLFLINKATGIGGEQMVYLMNIVKITLTQHEVDSIVHVIYTDKVIANDQRLPWMNDDDWADYIRQQMQSKAEGRDTSDDLWGKPYRVREVDRVPGRDGAGFVVRSAGPDGKPETEDDVVGSRVYRPGDAF